MLRRLGQEDVHVDIIFGSNVANVDISDVQKVGSASRLEDAKVTEILERFLPGKQADLLSYITRQYGLDVPAVVVAVEPLCRTNWLRLRRLILAEVRKYTKMFLHQAEQGDNSNHQDVYVEAFEEVF
ncbi:hypothetical protein N7533_008269 [Penicillium manginii]|jgi:hypothetical protein|uniref:uncharacterized protein n=1 Tax=Penicillium manginii TaxID=203109 RepID=UPI00254937BB|nr:uncharacterized protein N7533_008269 [Penicillium manginii]KAJ5751241.1 hypothetical protein N7533_008269 [Penicillium manginii]